MSDTLEPKDYEVIHVLLIEPTGEEDQFSLGDLLNRFPGEQLQVDRVDTVDGGLEKLKAGLPDVILVDLDTLDGRVEETIGRLVSASPTAPTIALVELSGENQGVEAVKYGAFDYLVKEQVTGPLVSHSVRHIVRCKRLLNEYDNHRAHMQAVMEAHTNALKRANLRLQQEIEERKLAEESEHRQRLLSESLRDITSCLLSSTDLKDIYRRILAGLKSVFPHDAANIMLVDADEVHVVGCLGYDQVGSSDEQMLKISYDLSALTGLLKMAGEGTPQIFNDVREDPDWLEDPKSSWIRSYAGAPIRVGDEVIGFLNLDSVRPDTFTLEHGLLLQTFADQAAIAIRNARLYQELEHYSIALQQAVDEATREAWEARDRIEVVFNSVGEGLVVLDLNKLIQRVNPALEALTGYPAADVVGLAYRLLLPKTELVEKQLSQVSEKIGSQGTWSGEFPFRRKNGTVFDAAVTVNPLKGPAGQPLGYVVSLRDISGYKELQHMKDTFLSTAAHELRTPLTAVQGFSEILLTRQLTEERKTVYLKMINEQAVRVSKIIDDLLDVSRLESGQGMTINAETFDLCRMIREAVHPFIETSKIHEYRFEFPTDPLMVCGDPFRLGQVINNLVSNATKYSPDGGQITIEAAPVDDHVEVAVQDEGFGISPIEQQHIFEKFYRADAAESTAGGTGLGLTIARLIVEMHEGKIWVDSREGQGSRFIFTVPQAES